MITKAKLNRCAHCPSRENLHVTFDSAGRLYFICTLHKLLLDSLISAAQRVGVAL